jgi:ubiquitin-conjugating enzyme E2 variant
MEDRVTQSPEAVPSLMKQRGWLSRIVEPASVAAFFVLQLIGWSRICATDSAGSVGTWVVFVLAALCAWLLADLASGLVHYFADNVGGPDTPLVGPLLIAPFREHHRAPEAMLENGFLERNANNALIVLPALVWVVWTDLDGPWIVGAAACSLQLGCWIFVTNQIHAWAHRVEVPWAVRGLQTAGVFLSFEQHERHHRAVREARPGSHYCITSGVCDRLVERVRRVCSRVP